MKKILILMSYLLINASCFAQSTEPQTASTMALKPSWVDRIQVSGKWMGRSEFRQWTDLKNFRDIHLTRLRLGLTWKVQPGISLFVQPQYAKSWGQVTYRPVDLNRNSWQPTSGVCFDNDMIVMHQAYLNYQLTPDWELKIGRQTLSYGDELVIGGGLGWHLYGRSFDAFKSVWTHDLGSLDAFWSRLVGHSIGQESFPPKADLWGLYARWKTAWIGLKDWDLYYFGQLEDQSPKSTINLTPFFIQTIGVRLKSSIDRWGYRLEMNYQKGLVNRQTQTASQFDVEMNYLLLPSSKTQLSWGFFTASPDYHQFLPAAHRWIGTTDVFGRRNMTGGVLKLGTQIIDRVFYQAELFRLFRTHPGQPVYQLLGWPAIGSGRETRSLDLGVEFDQGLRWDASSTVAFLGTASFLLPRGYFQSQPLIQGRIPFYFSFEMNVNF